jgi:hypothetical protein
MKKVSLLVVLSLFVSLFSSVSVMAASEKRIVINDSNYITISNFDEETMYLRDGWDENPIFASQSEVIVTFHGNDLRVDVAPYSYETKEFVLDANKGFTYFPVSKPAEELFLGEHSWIVNADSGDRISFPIEGFYMLSFYTDEGDYKGIFVHIQDRKETSASISTTANKSAPLDVEAKPNTAKVMLNGEEVKLEAYTIGGYNYFKLRDLAMALTGSEKQFEVVWDEVTRTIHLISGSPYTPIGGELVISEELKPVTGRMTTSKIYKDGQEIQLTVYTIGGYNYFKLRDIAQSFNIGVTWDNQTRAIVIDTSKDYVPDHSEDATFHLKIAIEELSHPVVVLPSFEVGLADSSMRLISKVSVSEADFNRNQGVYQLAFPLSAPLKEGDTYYVAILSASPEVKGLYYYKESWVPVSDQEYEYEIVWEEWNANVDERIRVTLDTKQFYDDNDEPAEKAVFGSRIYPVRMVLKLDPELTAFYLRDTDGNPVKNQEITISHKSGSLKTTSDERGVVLVKTSNLPGQTVTVVTEGRLASSQDPNRETKTVAVHNVTIPSMTNAYGFQSIVLEYHPEGVKAKGQS